jgi:hypothetical protein
MWLCCTVLNGRWELVYIVRMPCKLEVQIHDLASIHVPVLNRFALVHATALIYPSSWFS